ncbi:uncharacterized membrane protein YjjP (DUF1212 family) [Aliiruegeria haliotis]|uniref:Uncharacterized membrane protein YjjP (DUF1212 family) n=1 Tax=Aliiruegeria haliotis TaxID=1280846 RepID=A0A2T0RGC7_9RHOB|nr:threonine/serine exporter family protein [Aliiruegeria haliotis]PRY20223.1 uncharacterized membrane protein YjjP (DUF1212 family) [Aliiruegeria haliotis]
MTIEDRSQERIDQDELRNLLRELSQLLMSWSWEGVVGYEEIVSGVARTYGYEDVTVAMDAQMAIIELAGEVSVVKTELPGVPPLAYTQELKCLLADIFDRKLSVEDARAAIRDLADKKPPRSNFVVWLGAITLAVGLAIECVGTWEGIFFGAVTATLTGLCFVLASQNEGFAKIGPLVGTFASGAVVMIAYNFGWTMASPGLLLIPATFVFIPGDSISVQAYELAEGRWSAGVQRFFYSLMVLVLMVIGGFFATVVTGTPVAELFPGEPADLFPWWATYIGRAIILAGIMLAFHMTMQQFWRALAVLWAVTVVGQVTAGLWGSFAGTLMATTFGMALSLCIARHARSIPTFVLMVPVVFALSPGTHGLRQLETWVSGQQINGVNDLWTLGGVLLSIGIGMVLGRVIAGRWHWMANWPKLAGQN